MCRCLQGNYHQAELQCLDRLVFVLINAGKRYSSSSLPSLILEGFALIKFSVDFGFSVLKLDRDFVFVWGY